MSTDTLIDLEVLDKVGQGENLCHRVCPSCLPGFISLCGTDATGCPLHIGASCPLPRCAVCEDLNRTAPVCGTCGHTW